MKAIILASGIGKRLTPLIEELPKTLIEINGVALLDRMIKSLTENNVSEIIITTGYLEEKIKEFVKNKYPDLKATYVKNPIFDKTNYIYSLWLTKDIAKDDDIILLHGDMFFEPRLMKRVVDSEKSCALIKNSPQVPEKDFKARISGGLIKEIGVNVFGQDARFCAPIYKLLKDDFKTWINKIEEFINENNTNVYAEDALNKITDQLKFYPLYYNDEFAMEIDDFEDLEKAKKILKDFTCN